jgi:hypothetical protein
MKISIWLSTDPTKFNHKIVQMRLTKEKYSLVSLILLIVIVQTVIGRPYCSFRNYCMGCHQTLENICTACFNWGFRGIIGAKAFDGFSCRDSLIPERQVMDCKWYNGKQTNSTVARTTDECHICVLEFLNHTEGGKPWCGSKAINHKCAQISDCLTTVCYLNSKDHNPV